MKALKQYNWNNGNLSEIADITMGQSPPGSSYNDTKDGIGLINGPTEFTNKYPVVKQWTSKPTKLCKTGDILLCVRGSSTGRMNIADDEYCIGRGVASIRAKKEKAETNFIYYTLNYKINQLLQKTAGSTFPNLSSNEIKEMIVGIPPFIEQQKIASILSTWDKAIELKEKLIEQKKEQKKGLMQKLLTGEVRLPEFDGEWEKVKLGDICNITTGKLDANAMQNNGRYKFFTCAKEVYSIDDYAFETEALLVSGNGANVGYIHYYNGKFNAYQRTYVLDEFSNNIMFVKYLLDKDLQRRIHKEKNAGNTPYITLGTLSDMSLLLPSKDEQDEIANVLKKSDHEIELLEKEIEYHKNQKKGLMQLLLTGKVRVKV